jgi:hypothetical protein
MQCASCHFENMPGAAMCGRCGTSLQLATSAIDVYPPRASWWNRHVRRILPVSRARVRVAEWYDEVSRRGMRGIGAEDGTSEVVGRLLVPGWAHLRSGQRMRGRVFLLTWLGLLAGSVVMWGTMTGSLLIGLAFGLHTLAVSDILVQNPPAWASRRYLAGQAMLRAMLLGMLVYLPVGWLITRVAWPSVVAMTYGPFNTGDVVLVNQWAYLRSPPRTGDVVLYEMHRVTWQQGTYYFMHGGPRIDRVLAVAGDQVRWQDGRLWVNDAESGVRPLHPVARSEAVVLTVPEGSCLILPSADGPVMAQDQWEKLIIVPHERIDGRVYWRHHPLFQMGFVR